MYHGKLYLSYREEFLLNILTDEFKTKNILINKIGKLFDTVNILCILCDTELQAQFTNNRCDV